MERKPEISETGIPIALEDRFLIIGVGSGTKMAPSINLATDFARILQAVEATHRDITLVFDLRNLERMYDDIKVFLDCLTGRHPGNLAPRRECNVLISRRDRFAYSELDLQRWSPHIIKAKGPIGGGKLYNLDWVRELTDSDPRDSFMPDFYSSVHQLLTSTQATGEDENFDYVDKPVIDLTHGEIAERLDESAIFDILNNSRSAGRSRRHLHSIAREFARVFPDWVSLMRSERLSTRAFDSYGEIEGVGVFLCVTDFLAFLKSIERRSILVEFSMQAQPDKILCVPYHSFAIHNIEHPRRDDLLVGRPAVFASRTLGVFQNEVRQFEALINKRGVKEKELQVFLESHPNFLRGLNYQNIYPQVVLQREEGKSLRPDFILEPYKGDWCDILELKLPKPNLVIGRKDRDVLAGALHELAGQLREYAAYFENPKYQKWLYQTYGLRCYKPRLIGVVGRDMSKMTEPEIRRAMTCYADLEIVTFDKLLRVAKSRLLI